MRARAAWVAGTAVAVLATSGCPADPPDVVVTTEPPSAVVPPATTSTSSPTASPTSSPTSSPTPTATSTASDGSADLDGDGAADEVEVDGGALTAQLSTTGQVDAVALPDVAVADDVEVTGRTDLDADGREEAVVRTALLPSGTSSVVLRLGGSGLELLMTDGGEPFVLPFLGGNSGRRSYDCREADPRPGREVRVLDVERDGELSEDMTFSGFVTIWSVSGSAAVQVGTERVSAMPSEAEELSLDEGTCGP